MKTSCYPTTGTGLGLRGAQAIIHEHFDGSQKRFWKKRKLTYEVMDKPQRQPLVADGRSVNAQVVKAVAQRNEEHKPAPNHHWKNMPVGNPLTTDNVLRRSKKTGKADIFPWR